MNYTLIRNGTLIDGTGRKPLDNAAVLIKDNRIVAVEQEQSLSLPDVPLATIDARGGTILPGLIDTHVHLMLADVTLTGVALMPFSMQFYKAIENFRDTLNAGITSVRDAGGLDLGAKRAIEQGLVQGPRTQISISVLSITGGHLDGFLPSGITMSFLPEHPGRPDGICDGVDGVRKKVREVLRAGADTIKICATGGVLSPTDHPEFTQFSPEELDVIVREANYRNGVKVMAHAQGMEGIKNAIRAGVHSIEHGIFLDEEACEMMCERGTFLVPTLLAPVAVMELASERGISAESLQQSLDVMDAHRESITLAHKMGVKIAMGTDAGVMPHGTNLRELKLMCAAGLSPMDSIVATTKTAAECLGWDDRLGTIEVGKLADITITTIDPLTDIGALANNETISHVILDGKMVKGSS